MKRKVKKGLALAWLVSLLLMVSVGLAQADGSGPSVAPGFRPLTILQNPKEIRPSQENPSSESVLMHSRNVATGQTQSGAGYWGWLQNHGQGLLYGLAEGMVVAAGVVAVGALLSVGAPVLAVAAGAAVLGAAAYGLFTGAERFNVWECGVYALIGAMSAGVGQGLAAAGLVGRGLVVARVAVDVVGGGLVGLASYLLHSPDPTWSGAAGAFGLGAATAGLFLGLGYGWGKLKAALGLSGWSAAGNSSAIVVEGVAHAAERGGVESAGTVVVESNLAALKRAGRTEATETIAFHRAPIVQSGVDLTDSAWSTPSLQYRMSIIRSNAPVPGSLDNRATRQWYLDMDAQIPALIDAEAPLAVQARQAFELRNLFRTLAREAMADRELAAKLMETEPNLTWEQIVQKQADKGLTGDDIYRAILRSAQKTRQSVNEALGVSPKH